MKNRSAKFALIILLFLACKIVGKSQTTCDLSAKNAPLLLDLQIGSSPEQTQAILGRALKIKIKKKGERTFFQNYIKNPAPEPLRGVRALYLRFFDLKLYQIEIFYESRAGLQSLETVKNALSTQLSLPFENWQIKDNRAEIRCGEKSLVTDYILNPRIELTDETVRAEIEKLRENKKK